MAHGGYTFYFDRQGGEVYQSFANSKNTAYTEFGVPSISSVENLKRMVPEDELFPPRETDAWVAHHGFGAWVGDTWLCLSTLEKYFGKPQSLEELVDESNWLQCEGYRTIFEEARKQWPRCSMAINWCYEEPWKTAANNSIIEYPTTPKPAYKYVKDALRPSLFSARLKKFEWSAGETFEAELWLLNDKPERAYGKVKAVLQIGDRTLDLLEWTAEADAGLNTQGPTVRLVLPHADTDRMTLILLAENGIESRYTLQYKPTSTPVNTVKILNM
jgi:beta-mannosidase